MAPTVVSLSTVPTTTAMGAGHATDHHADRSAAAGNLGVVITTRA